MQLSSLCPIFTMTIRLDIQDCVLGFNIRLDSHCDITWQFRGFEQPHLSISLQGLMLVITCSATTPTQWSVKIYRNKFLDCVHSLAHENQHNLFFFFFIYFSNLRPQCTDFQTLKLVSGQRKHHRANFLTRAAQINVGNHTLGHSS